MRNCALATDIIQIRSKETNEAMPLGNFANGADLLNVIAEYLADRSMRSVRDESRQRLLRVTDFAIHGREIRGFIEKGEYGTVEPLVDADTFDVVHMKQRDEAPMFPHYFRFVLPEDATDGLVILERSGRRGIKGNLQLDLGNYVEQNFDDSKVELSPLLPSQLLNLFMDRGEITQIRFINYRIPTDIFDRLRIDPEAQEVTTELIIKIKGGAAANDLKRRFRNLWNEGNEVTEFVRVAGINYEDIKVEFSISGHKRIISLDNPFNRGASWDITDEQRLVFSESGHPTIDSLDAIAGEYAHDILQQLRRAGQNV